MIDIISDTITRIRNGLLIGSKNVLAIHSQLNLRVLEALKQDGYIADYNTVNVDNPKKRKAVAAAKVEDQSKEQTSSEPKGFQHKKINIVLKYHKGVPVIRSLKRVSKPSKRVYAGRDQFKTSEQYCTLIVSTNKGVMSHVDAKKNNLGGEVLFEVSA